MSEKNVSSLVQAFALSPLPWFDSQEYGNQGRHVLEWQSNHIKGSWNHIWERTLRGQEINFVGLSHCHYGFSLRSVPSLWIMHRQCPILNTSSKILEDVKEKSFWWLLKMVRKTLLNIINRNIAIGERSQTQIQQGQAGIYSKGALGWGGPSIGKSAWGDINHQGFLLN